MPFRQFADQFATAATRPKTACSDHAHVTQTPRYDTLCDLPTLVVPPVAEQLALRFEARRIIPLGMFTIGMFTIGLGFMLMKSGSSAGLATIDPHDAFVHAALVHGFGLALLYGGLGAWVLALLSLVAYGTGSQPRAAVARGSSIA